jgi:hypothetical protein
MVKEFLNDARAIHRTGKASNRKIDLGVVAIAATGWPMVFLF